MSSKPAVEKGVPQQPKPEDKQDPDQHSYPDEEGHENRDLSNPDEEEELADPGFCSMVNFRVAIVHVIGATLNGYSIGFVGVYSTFFGMSNNCAGFRHQLSCETAPNMDCKWDAAGGYCGWQTGTCSQLHNNIPDCEADKRCHWAYGDDGGACANPSGYSSSNNGIFAGSMIAGCMIGSFFAGGLTTAIGAKLAFLLIGIVCLICSVMYHVSAAENEFWVLIVARFVVGLTLGVVGVACPVYVDQNGHPKYKRMIGVLFQLFTTFGIFFAATIGLAVGQSVEFKENRDFMLMARMQALCVFSTFFSMCMIVLGIVVSDSKAKFGNDDDEEEDDGEHKAKKQNANEYGWFQMLPRLAMGGVMAGTLQLTGINAVMNYAPTIMGSLGTAPLVGNFVVMVWNFVTTIAAIPLASIFTMRQLFLFGSAFTSAMCLFLCGIPVYPGVTKKKEAKNGVAITGILLFIAGFETCVGPCYYVLTQDMFPPSFRPKGASCTQVIQFIFNLIINVCYPIATEDISGGPSGNQDKGQAIAFIFFGGLGIICFIIQVFFLHPWPENGEEGAEGAENDEPAAEDGNRADGDDMDQMSPVEVASPDHDRN